MYFLNYKFIRLEVQADVASSQRFSLSSETTSNATSLSDTKSLADDGGASTRALAGSVLNFKVQTHINCKPKSQNHGKK